MSIISTIINFILNRKKPVEVLPKLKKELIAWATVIQELAQIGLECQLKPSYSYPDMKVHTTNLEGWNLMVPYLTYSGELYVSEDADCEDYARWASSDASKLFQLGSCLQCWGHVSNSQANGSHAWNLVRVDVGEWMTFDANAGFDCSGSLFKIGENGYIPGSWKI